MSRLTNADVPPIWLAGFAALGWALGRWLPVASFGGWAIWAGWVLVGAGVVLTALSAREFRRHRTSIIPYQTPSGLVDTGIYRLTRNPIYLGDALALLGLILIWDAVLSLPLVVIFMVVISRRFIRWEEARLVATFGADAQAYMARVRRWI